MRSMFELGLISIAEFANGGEHSERFESRERCSVSRSDSG